MQIATISTRKYKTREAPEPSLNEANMFVTFGQWRRKQMTIKGAKLRA